VPFNPGDKAIITIDGPFKNQEVTIISAASTLAAAWYNVELPNGEKIQGPEKWLGKKGGERVKFQVGEKYVVRTEHTIGSIPVRTIAEILVSDAVPGCVKVSMAYIAEHNPPHDIWVEDDDLSIIAPLGDVLIPDAHYKWAWNKLTQRLGEEQNQEILDVMDGIITGDEDA